MLRSYGRQSRRETTTIQLGIDGFGNSTSRACEGRERTDHRPSAELLARCFQRRVQGRRERPKLGAPSRRAERRPLNNVLQSASQSVRSSARDARLPSAVRLCFAQDGCRTGAAARGVGGEGQNSALARDDATLTDLQASAGTAVARSSVC